MKSPKIFAIVCALVVTVAVTYVTNVEIHHGENRVNNAPLITAGSYVVGEGFGSDDEIIATCAAVPDVWYSGWPFISYLEGSGCGFDGEQATLFPVGIALNAAIGAVFGGITFAIITFVRRSK